MRKPGFLDGVLVAFALAVAGSLLHGVLSILFDPGFALRLLIGAATFGYLSYLLSRCRHPSGRVTLLGLWFLTTCASALLIPSLLIYLLLQTVFVWFARSLYFYSSPLSAVADLGVNALSLAAAAWASYQTGGVFAALWVYFLTQAAFVFIPVEFAGKPGRVSAAGGKSNDFSTLYRTALEAERKISERRSNSGRI